MNTWNRIWNLGGGREGEKGRWKGRKVGEGVGGREKGEREKRGETIHKRPCKQPRLTC